MCTYFGGGDHPCEASTGFLPLGRVTYTRELTWEFPRQGVRHCRRCQHHRHPRRQYDELLGNHRQGILPVATVNYNMTVLTRPARRPRAEATPRPRANTAYQKEFLPFLVPERGIAKALGEQGSPHTDPSPSFLLSL